VGTLESLWSAQVVGMSARSTQPSIFEEQERRQRSLAEHEQLVALIASGDAWQAAAAAAAHLRDRPETSYGFSGDVVVDASMVRYQEHEASELDD
jgi:DNA-binding GntR family transcriptional regulator